jgi:hypothetical protein
MHMGSKYESSRLWDHDDNHPRPVKKLASAVAPKFASPPSSSGAGGLFGPSPVTPPEDPVSAEHGVWRVVAVGLPYQKVRDAQLAGPREFVNFMCDQGLELKDFPLDSNVCIESNDFPR